MNDDSHQGSATDRRTLIVGSLITVAILIAAVMSGCATFKRWAYEDFGDRDEWQQSERVISELGLQAGQRVADVGSGGGYFTFRLAEAVGANGRVYAVDVDQSMLDYVRGEAEKRALTNVTVVHATFDDPKIPAPVDLVFVSNTYHHLDDRPAYFERIRTSYLAAGGRIAIVEYLGDKAHATPRATIETEMGEAGFALASDNAWLERQSYLIFAAK
jgi:arsenite methyltransferase